MSDARDCYDCLYRDIRETSYEWIDCFCQKQNNKQVSIQYNCPLYLKEPTREEKIEFINTFLKQHDWNSGWPPTAESKLAHQIMHDITNYLINNRIDIRKKD